MLFFLQNAFREDNPEDDLDIDIDVDINNMPKMLKNDKNKKNVKPKQQRNKVKLPTLPRNRRIASLGGSITNSDNDENENDNDNNRNENNNSNHNDNDNINEAEPNSVLQHVNPCAPAVQNSKQQSNERKKPQDCKFKYFLNDVETLKDGKDMLNLLKKQKDREMGLRMKEQRIEELKQQGVEATDEKINEVLSPYHLTLIGSTEAEIKEEDNLLESKYQHILELRETITNGKVPKQHGFRKQAIETVCNLL